MINPPDSVREALRDTVALYRRRRDHPNWLNDRWAESFDESFATIADAPRYIDQLAAFAARLVTGGAILLPAKQELANAAGRQLLRSELTEAEQASIERR
jgi:hypothetical protein